MKRVILTLMVAGASLLFSCNPSDNNGKDSKDKKEISRKDDEESASDEEEEESTVEEKATTELCGCINKAMGDINPKVRRIIVKAGNSTDPMTTLQTELQKITDEEEQQQIATQFTELSENPQVQKCSERIKKKYDLDDNDKAAQKRIMAAAKNNEDCDVVYALMKIGLQQETKTPAGGTGDDQ